MSNKSDINSGLIQGGLQGLKGGLAYSRMESGIKKGMMNGISRRDKVQDPATMPSGKGPFAYWVADIFPAVADGTTVGSVPNLSGAATLTIGGSPVRRKGCGSKYFIDFDNSGDVIQTSSTTGTKELTVMTVFRPSSTVVTDTTIFARENSSVTQAGDIFIDITGSNKIALTFISSSSTTTSLRYESSVLPDYTLTQAVKTGANTNRWILLTAKFDSTRGTVNPTRDIELSINGTKVGLTLVTNTWNLSSAGTNLPNVSCFFGNDSDGLNPGTSGTQLAAGIVFNYWINEADQLRIENFFKHYYGIRF
jgi:hypothetical protein